MAMKAKKKKRRSWKDKCDGAFPGLRPTRAAGYLGTKDALVIACFDEPVKLVYTKREELEQLLGYVESYMVTRGMIEKRPIWMTPAQAKQIAEQGFAEQDAEAPWRSPKITEALRKNRKS